MFLSKKLLMSNWIPKVEEFFSTSTSSVASSAYARLNTVFVGQNNIFYTQGSKLRSVVISDAASTQTDVAAGNGFYFAEGDSDSTSETFYSYAQTQNDITFGKYVINVAAETGVFTTTTKNWAHSSASIITMFGDDIIWSNTTTSASTLFSNTTSLLTYGSSGGYGYSGKPSSTTVLAGKDNIVYQVTSSSATPLFTSQATGGVKYVQGKYYVITYSPTTTLSRINSDGTVAWTSTFYADEEESVAVTLKFLGTANNKFYGVSFPTSVYSTSPYYKFLLWEIDMNTGAVYHKYALPMPRGVTDGLVSAENVLTYAISNFTTGIVAKNRRFAFPILVGYSKNYVFYHDWFIITVPA